MLSKAASSTIFWLDQGLNPGLPNRWPTLCSRILNLFWYLIPNDSALFMRHYRSAVHPVSPNMQRLSLTHRHHVVLVVKKRNSQYLSLRVFGLLSSSLLSFPQRFGRYVLRPSSGVYRTREPSQNFELRPLLNPRGSLVLISLAITGYKC